MLIFFFVSYPAFHPGFSLYIYAICVHPSNIVIQILYMRILHGMYISKNIWSVYVYICYAYIVHAYIAWNVYLQDFFGLCMCTYVMHILYGMYISKNIWSVYVYIYYAYIVHVYIAWNVYQQDFFLCMCTYVDCLNAYILS